MSGYDQIFTTSPQCLKYALQKSEKKAIQSSS